MVDYLATHKLLMFTLFLSAFNFLCYSIPRDCIHKENVKFYWIVTLAVLTGIIIGLLMRNPNYNIINVANHQKTNFWNWEHIVMYSFSVLSFLFSLIVLSKCFPRLIEIPNETGFDYIGFIVGTLSILVAILIGWNIYTIIDIHKIRKEFDDLKGNVTQQIESISSDLSNKLERSIIEYYNSMALMNNEHGEHYFLLFHYMNMLVHQSRIGLYDDCNNTIVRIMTIEAMTVVQHRRDVIFILLGQIQNADKIGNYTQLVDFLSSNLIMESMARPSK